MPWYTDEYKIVGIDDCNYINFHMCTRRFFHKDYIKNLKDLSKYPEMELYNLYEKFIKEKCIYYSSFGIKKEYTMEDLIAFSGTESPIFTGVNEKNEYVIAIDKTLVDIFTTVKNICNSTLNGDWVSAYNRFIWQVSSTCNKYYMNFYWDEKHKKFKRNKSKDAKWHFVWNYKKYLNTDEFINRFSNLVFDRIPTIRDKNNVLVTNPSTIKEKVICYWWEFVFNHFKNTLPRYKKRKEECEKLIGYLTKTN